MENDYRQFGLLFCAQQEYLRNRFGQGLVLQKKKDLIRDRRLVLVLDLDNTLLHSNLFEVGKVVLSKD